MGKFIDLTGQRFGRLVAMERDISRAVKGKHTYWVCKCDCGKITKVRADELKNGTVLSCGCYHSEVSSVVGKTSNLKHGMSDSRLFNIWAGIKTRCLNEKSRYYFRYGGRGIYICDEWKDDFGKFLDWSQKNGYSQKLQIDRIDNNGPYSPWNCRWVTPKQNSRNRSDNREVTINGVKYKTISEAADSLGILNSSISNQIKKKGTNLKFIQKGRKKLWTIGQ